MKSLRVRKSDNIVCLVTEIGGVVVAEQEFMPNGHRLRVNTETKIVEEIDSSQRELLWTGVGYASVPKLKPLKSHGNSVLFHPERLEFAEVVRSGYSGALEKVRDYRPQVSD